MTLSSAPPMYVFPPPAPVALPVHESSALFPVHRIYCVGRNYVEHAQEMGHSGREAPFFFMKPADAVVPVAPGTTAALPYPSLTANLHHEVELVVAIGKGGANIRAAQAHEHIFGYAVGLDMTRRDLQNDMKKQGRPWCIAKGFDHSAPVGALVAAPHALGMSSAGIHLQVNGVERQRSALDKLIWNVAETIEQLSSAWALQAGDLIFTGTPAGVAAVSVGDTLLAQVDGLPALSVVVVPGA